VNGLDDFLVKSIILAIKDEISAERVQSLEQKLERKHGVKFSDLFNKYDEVKNSLFEFECELIEDEILREFLTVEEEPVSSEEWLVIKNKQLTERILKTFADVDKKLILDLTRDSAETIPKILSLCNLPNTSGYRKMNQLVEDGFVIAVGLSETFEGKRALVYKSIIQKIQIIINKNEIYAKLLVPKDILTSSQIVMAITGATQNKSNSFAN
jgi:uncharacterized protein YfbU (UPF0304 family)